MTEETAHAISQSYYIGTREPGDIVIPVRMVLAADGQIVVRCVGLRDGGKSCEDKWIVGELYRGCPDLAPLITGMLTHMEIHHAHKS